MNVAGPLANERPVALLTGSIRWRHVASVVAAESG
jgi:hypothetical protein